MITSIRNALPIPGPTIRYGSWYNSLTGLIADSAVSVFHLIHGVGLIHFVHRIHFVHAVWPFNVGPLTCFIKALSHGVLDADLSTCEQAIKEMKKLTPKTNIQCLNQSTSQFIYQSIIISLNHLVQQVNHSVNESLIQPINKEIRWLLLKLMLQQLSSNSVSCSQLPLITMTTDSFLQY